MPASFESILNVHPSIRTIARLDDHEVYRGQVFHAGHLWEGHSSGTVDDYRIDVHAADCVRVLASAPVRHTLEFLHPYGPRAVLAVGKHYHRRRGWLTFHSAIRFEAGGPASAPRLRVTTRTLPRMLQVEQFAGSPRAMYFTEPGSRRVFHWNGWWARGVGAQVALPGTMLQSGRHLFVLERNQIRSGQENIARIDLATDTIQRTFASPRRHLTNILDLDGLPWIAAAEAWADQVLLVDKQTNRLAATLAVPGTPTEIGRLGNCLVVFAADRDQLDFFDITRPGMPLLARWDLAGLGADFSNVRSMQIDPATGSVFLRSPYHARVEGNQPAVKMVVDPDGETFRRCHAPAGTMPRSSIVPCGACGAA